MNRETSDQNSGRSLALIPEPDLGLRVTRAQFARMVGVSRTQVTRWVQAGIIAVGPDKRFDPHKAFQRLVNHLDPSRSGVHLGQSVARELSELRAALGRVRQEAEHWKAQASTMESGWSEMDRAVELLLERIRDSWDQLSGLDAAVVYHLLEELLDEAIIAAGDERGPPGAEAFASPLHSLDADSESGKPGVDVGDGPSQKKGGCGVAPAGEGGGHD